MLTVNDFIRIPYSEFRFQFSRSSGPGGQNVNKVNSKALLYWRPTASFGISESMLCRFLEKFANKLNTDGEFFIASDKYRDRSLNQEDCLDKLRVFLVSVAAEPKIRKKSKPSFSSKKRRQEGKRLRGKTKATRRKVSRED